MKTNNSCNLAPYGCCFMFFIFVLSFIFFCIWTDEYLLNKDLSKQDKKVLEWSNDRQGKIIQIYVSKYKHTPAQTVYPIWVVLVSEDNTRIKALVQEEQCPIIGDVWSVKADRHQFILNQKIHD